MRRCVLSSRRVSGCQCHQHATRSTGSVSIATLTLEETPCRTVSWTQEAGGAEQSCCSLVTCVDGPGSCLADRRPSIINNMSSLYFLKIEAYTWHPCFFESLSSYAENLNVKPLGNSGSYEKEGLLSWKTAWQTVQVTAHRHVWHRLRHFPSGHDIEHYKVCLLFCIVYFLS